ncbi:MAG: hypothetical protein ACWGQW_18090 [bacterium]
MIRFLMEMQMEMVIRLLMDYALLTDLQKAILKEMQTEMPLLARLSI